MGAPQADGLSSPTEPCSTVSALTGFDPSRKNDAFQIELDATRRRTALRTAQSAALALQWLLESGVRCVTDPEGYGHNWRGGEEGRGYHSDALKEAACRINQRAIEMAIADMEEGYASAIEARSGETQSGSTEGESATRQGDAHD